MDKKQLSMEYGLSEAEAAALAEHFTNRFADCPGTEPVVFPLAPWQRMAEYADSIGAHKVINAKLCAERPVKFRSPESVRIEIFRSFAGSIPIIYAGDPADFEALVTNIVHKGVRPVNISSTGASFVSGRSVRFIILSAKPYSNVPASELGLDEALWAEKSVLIRRSHECTHFFTKQTYGAANNLLHDELMADFIGLYDAFGFYKAEWFGRFMGIIKGSGSRLEVYTAGLSEMAKQAAADIIMKAAESLEAWSQSAGFRALDNAERIRLMCRAGVEDILSGQPGR